MVFNGNLFHIQLFGFSKVLLLNQFNFMIFIDVDILLLNLLVSMCLDEPLYATVSEFWSQSLFFEVVAPDEVAYVYKIRPALGFGISLVRCSYQLLLRIDFRDFQ